MAAASNYDDLVSAQTEAKQKKGGVWTTDENLIEKHTRNVTYSGDGGFNAAKLLEESK